MALFAAAPVEALAQGGYAGALAGHGGPVKAAATSPSGTRVLTASFDYALGLWDGATGDRILWLDGHDAAVTAAAFVSETQVLSGGDDFSARLWDVETGAVRAVLTGHAGKVNGVAAAPDGGLAATASWDGTVGLWDLAAAAGETAPLRLLQGHEAAVNAVAFARDGARVFSGSADGTVRAWPVAGGEPALIARHGFGVNVLAAGPDDAWLAYGATDGVVRVIDLASRDEIAALTGDRRPILALAVSPSGARLAYGDGHGFISVVDVADWTITHDYRAALRGPIWALAFLDEERLVAAGIENDAVVWPIGAASEPIFPETQTLTFNTDDPALSNGARQFARKCSVCHTLEPDTARRAGPSLYGVFGRVAGTYADYVYSGALTGSDIVWSAETIDALFDLGPEHVTPGSKMPMQVIADPRDRADLIAFLEAATAPDALGPGAPSNQETSP